MVLLASSAEAQPVLKGAFGCIVSAIAGDVIRDRSDFDVTALGIVVGGEYMRALVNQRREWESAGAVLLFAPLEDAFLDLDPEGAVFLVLAVETSPGRVDAHFPSPACRASYSSRVQKEAVCSMAESQSCSPLAQHLKPQELHTRSRTASVMRPAPRS